MVPHELHTITPYCTVADADAFIDFLQTVFGGEVLKADRTDAGRIGHARVRIGDSIVMINEAGGDYAANVSQLHIYVDDVESTHARALDHGSVSVMEPNRRPHGDDMAGIRDPQGNVWWIAAPA